MNKNITLTLRFFCEKVWNLSCYLFLKNNEHFGKIFIYIAIYQQLLLTISQIGSQSRRLQEKLISDFELLYPNINKSRIIVWLDFRDEIIETMLGETADYSFGYHGEQVRDAEQCFDSGWSINRALFSVRPLTDEVFDRSNFNNEIVRRITDILTLFWPSTLDDSIPGENELFALMVEEVSNMIICGRRDLTTVGFYLYCFQSSVLGDLYSKKDCEDIAVKLINVFGETEGGEPTPIQGEI